jgi:hypothetical protein
MRSANACVVQTDDIVDVVVARKDDGTRQRSLPWMVFIVRRPVHA